MNRRIQQVLHLKEMVGKLRQIQESRLVSLEARRRRIEADIEGIRQALARPLVRDLPMFAPALQRIAGLEKQCAEITAAMSRLRTELICSRSRGKWADGTAREMIHSINRREREKDLLETVVGTLIASPPQGARD